MYKGCTIIDVHPGACVWSSKLHDFLKPKRHILMEPEMRYYDQFIKPLLEKPDSKYRHSLLCGSHPREYWNNYRSLLDDKTMFPDQPALTVDDPKLRELDTSILFTGNLWRKYPINHKANYVDHSSLILQHMTYGALTNDIFQRSGLVRMLWWAPDATKTMTLPTNIRGKRGYDMSLQMGASLTEVAGVSRLETALRKSKMDSPRTPKMDAYVAGRVKRGMAEKGQVIPEGREQPMALEPTMLEDDFHAHDSILKTTCTTIDDLEKAVKDYKELLEEMQAVLVSTRIRKEGGRLGNRTSEALRNMYTRHVRYQQSVDAIKSRPNDMTFHSSKGAEFRAVVAMDTTARLLNLEANYAAVREINFTPASNDPDYPTATAAAAALSTLHDQILALNKFHATLIDGIVSSSTMKTIHTLLEDLISLEAQPPIIPRDRRPHEPLRAFPHEFWPQYDLTLLDLTPRPRDLSSPGVADKVEGIRACQEVIKIVHSSTAIPLTTALDRVAPNAAQDLVPLVPAITDARKGGRMDPSQMSVRMLSHEMMDGLIRAFLEWPFRPSSVDLALAQAEGEGQTLGDEDGDVDGVPVE